MEVYKPGTIRVTWLDGSHDDLSPSTRATAVVLSRTGELEVCNLEYTRGQHFVHFIDAQGDELRLRVSDLERRRGVASAVELPGPEGLRWRNGKIESVEEALARAERAVRELMEELTKLHRETLASFCDEFDAFLNMGKK